MQINLTGHHIDITPALRSYVNEKLDKLARHFDGVGMFMLCWRLRKWCRRQKLRFM